MAHEDLVGDVAEPDGSRQEILSPVTKLPIAYELFCLHYVANRCKGVVAARLAGWSGNKNSLNTQAKRLLAKPEIQQRIAELVAPTLSAAKVNMDTMLGQLAAVATYDRRRLYNEDGSRKHFTELDDETAAAISHMGPNDFVPFDKLKAIDMAMKHLGGYEKDNKQKQENLQIAVIFE